MCKEILIESKNLTTGAKTHIGAVAMGAVQNISKKHLKQSQISSKIYFSNRLLNHHGLLRTSPNENLSPHQNVIRSRKKLQF